MGKSVIFSGISVGGDEYYTLKKDAETIVDNIADKTLKVWLPFNDKNSAFEIVLKERGFDVVTTETDFFTTPKPDGVQCVISNPPFSKKTDVLKRLQFLDIKFALILPFLYLNNGVPLDYGKQIILFRKRMKFATPDGIKTQPANNCFVLSNGLLKKDLTIVMGNEFNDNISIFD